MWRGGGKRRGLTGVRVAGQAALSTSQCCWVGSKRDAVVILRKKKERKKKETFLRVEIEFQDVYFKKVDGLSFSPPPQECILKCVFIAWTHQWYSGLQHLQVIIAIHLRLRGTGMK